MGLDRPKPSTDNLPMSCDKYWVQTCDTWNKRTNANFELYYKTQYKINYLYMGHLTQVAN